MTGASASPLAAGLTVRESAARWAARIDRGELSASERRELDAWLEIAEHRKALDRAVTALHLFDDLDGDQTVQALHRSALAAKPTRPTWLPAAVAAAVAILVAGAALLFNHRHELFPGGRDIAMAEAQGVPIGSPRGERRAVRLADGSRLVLNTDTLVVAHISSTERRLELVRGQALFKVARDPTRPFSVSAADWTVTALGTVFEVRRDAKRTQVLLVEGRVVVDRSGGNRPDTPRPLVMKVGEELLVQHDAEPKLRHVDVGAKLMWQQGLVSFDDVALSEAVAEMNRYVAQPLLVSDSVAGMRLSGVFRTGDSKQFGELVGELLPLHTRRRVDGHLELVEADAPR